MLEASSETFADLLKAAGVPFTILALEPCTQGRNNRTLRLETDNGRFILKQYLKQKGDIRDRLSTEFSFLRYARATAPRFVPDAYMKNAEQGWALYEYIEGRPLQPEEIGEAEVTQAADFFCALNQGNPRNTSEAQALPVASEACFSVQAHFDLIDQRLAKLAEFSADSLQSAETQGAATVIQELNQTWSQLKPKLVVAAEARGLIMVEELSLKQRCLSPSDFGFHNALRRPDGSLCFLDFEYAGWDDPAKMTGDFFSQLALPVPATLFKQFSEQTLGVFEQKALLLRRAELLRVVYRIKWCCIALNIFLPLHLNRYRFSNPQLDVDDFKRQQLNKVRTLMQTLETLTHGLY